MNKKQQDEFKQLVKEGALEALKSSDGQSAIVDAMYSLEGQDAIKRGALAAFKSKEGKDILDDSFAGNFREVVMPSLEYMTDDINQIKTDVAYLKESAVSKEEFNRKLRTKILAGTSQ